MFSFFKKKLSKIYSGITSALLGIFQQKAINENTIQSIKQLLLKADTGVTTTNLIVSKLQEAYQAGTLKEGEDVKVILEQELTKLLPESTTSFNGLKVILLVGINGSGKTTFVGKLANHFKKAGHSCLIAAADTFRAAAPEQLKEWAERSGAELVMGKENQDPASVAFAACEQFKKDEFDHLIIDTAGRLQTKEHLMRELEKIKRIIAKQLPDHTIHTFLTIDAMLGQNSLEQAKLFNEVTKLDGVILTKLDGTAKGGTVFAITHELKIPVVAVSYGEHIDDITPFSAKTYISHLLGETSFQSNK